MKIAREALISHLRRIHCEGLLPDIVLSGQFQGVGISVDRLVLVTVGPLDKAEPLPGETGITNLGMLLKVLDSMIDDEVSFSIEGQFIVIGAHDRTFKLVTSNPRSIGTKVSDETKDKISSLVPSTAEWHALEHRFVEGTLKASGILRAEAVTFEVRSLGALLRVGDPRMNVADFELPDYKSAAGYDLSVASSHIVPVFKQLSDFTKAQMALTGPDSVVAIREGGYTYYVSSYKEEEKKA